MGLVITLFQLPMSTFIMRNAFDAIPKDMEEAAMVDGCNSLQALFKIPGAGGQAFDGYGWPARLP